MKVLVTGGFGFIGGHVVERLLADGHELVVLDSLDPQAHPEQVLPKWTWNRFDARWVNRPLEETGDGLLTGILQAHQIDTVVHLAAQVGVGQSMYEIEKYVRGNTLAAAVLLDAVVKCKSQIRKLVVASSMSVYGEGAYWIDGTAYTGEVQRSREQLETGVWEPQVRAGQLHPGATHESHPMRPQSIYAITKRDHEEMFLSVGRAYGIETSALRFFNVYGPRQCLSNPYTGVVSIFAQAMAAGNAPTIYEDGGQLRDFVYVSDVAEAVVRAAEMWSLTGVVNIGSGRCVSIRRIAKELASLIGFPLDQVNPNGQFRPGDVRHCFADIAAMKYGLGVEPKVMLAEGLRLWWEWAEPQIRGLVDRTPQAQQELRAQGLLS